MKISKLKGQIQKRSIAINIISGFLVLILAVTIVMSLISYAVTYDIVKKNSISYTTQLIGQVNSDIESYISYMENISQFVVSNPDVQEYMESNFLHNKYSEDLLETKITFQLESFLKIRKDISNIMIFRSDGRAVLNKDYLELNENTNIKMQPWYRQAIKATGKITVSSSHVQNVVKDDYRWVISLSRAIFDKNGKILGVLLVDLNYSVISDLCNKITLGEGGYVFILDGEGDILFHPNQQLIYNNIKTENTQRVFVSDDTTFTESSDTGEKMYTVLTSPLTGWKTVGVAYVEKLMFNKVIIQTYYIIIAIVFLLIASIVSIAISRTLTSPILKLRSFMKQAEKGDFDIYIDHTGQDELGELSQGFNAMLREIKHLMESSIEIGEQKRQSELKALQAQINPHFLYNTLDSIIWMAESGQMQEVVSMTSALAGLFRTSISKGAEIIPLTVEIKNIEAYLTIQKMRYKDKLSYIIDIDEDILNCKVIKLILQPIVENAIYHGIKTHKSGGSITISGCSLDETIVLSIEDDGNGMSAEQLSNVFSPKQKKSRGSGIGIINVNERIKLYFGDNYGLKYYSNEGEGTRVDIVLPKLISSNEGDDTMDYTINSDN